MMVCSLIVVGVMRCVVLCVVTAHSIRAVDPNHLIFFEGVTWDDFGVGFTQVPGGTPYQNLSVLSIHYYFPPQLDSPAKDLQIQVGFARKLGAGAVLTEFWSEDHGPTSLPAITQTVQAADEQLMSWIGWSYKGFWSPDDFGQTAQ
jgi:endoglycosylceramidase